MTETRNLLVEIGTEELPPKALRRLSEAFADGMSRLMDEAGLEYEGIQPYAAPRRLALLIRALPPAQQDREVVRRGPALAAAFDEDGCPTKAATGFAKSCGIEVEQLDQLETPKGSWLSFRAVEKGKATAELVPGMVQRALAGLPVPKRMRWGDREEEFVRPVHWVVLLFGEEVISAPVLGITAGRETRGHRFHHPQTIALASADDYVSLLCKPGHVLVDYRARRDIVRKQVIERGEELGGKALIDEDLLDEVCSLVEWPVAIAGQFDEAFLEVPSEALISSMQDHQKYFPVLNNEGCLLPCFITVANLESRDPEQIRAGNERVIRPRLSDAAFFWNQDRKTPLSGRADGLRNMVFQKKLGTLFDKQERIAKLAASIVTQIGGDPAHAERAARLSKCDLLTSMVYEFPELQGIMGRYYALHDGAPEAVAVAIEEHYLPRFSGDRLPQHPVGQTLAIADRLDSLVGIFAIGQPPSGDKDPFALRRAALGLVRVIIEGKLDLDLEALLQQAASGFDPGIKADEAVNPVFDYVMDRLRGYYQDNNIPADLVEAVLVTRPVRLLDFDKRIRACQVFRELPEATALAAANKRIANILRKAEQPIPERIDNSLLVDTAEKQLAEELAALKPDVLQLMEQGNYTPALQKLAGLRDAVDTFFDKVMVMVEDDALRANRLALLNELGALFLRTADLSRLQH
ncbi:glycyl-tRNA synthetase beta chain [Thiogranum longum]|uniref:Glycine--tRNA ligase beta subunit n=1 Tax=Thiogranum longum TaxID=1537524 RepID=A0A4R1HCE5_9GAMM|nr:glycine--tRNA ligase subunit beta [Thiogranum longum]TCK16889.1 glycyl-tRNA synthetase beta chain [Thiogranum longum]